MENINIKARIEELETKLKEKGKLSLKEKGELSSLKSKSTKNSVSAGNNEKSEEESSILALKSGNKVKSVILNIYDIKPNPYQPRKHLTQKEIDDQAETIRALGLIEKIIVCKIGDDYSLLAGQKRLEGLKKLNKEEEERGLEKYEMKWLSIDVDVREDIDGNDPISIRKVSLAENLGRTNPLVVDTAIAISELYSDLKKENENITQRDFAEIIGKELGIGSTVGTINKYLKIASLEKEIINAIVEKNINSISILYQIAKSEKSTEEKLKELQYVEEGKSLKDFEAENKSEKEGFSDVSAGNKQEPEEEGEESVSAGNKEIYIDAKFLSKHLSSINKCSSQTEAREKAQVVVDYLLKFIANQAKES